MKDATGGSLLMGLAATILIIFIIFVAFFINYGKTFKIKNLVINKLEQSEGLNFSALNDYIYEEAKYGAGKPYEICYNEIRRGLNFVGITYKLKLFMTFERTILSDTEPLKIKIPISGETKTIISGEIYKNIVDLNKYPEGINECIK